MVDIVKDLQLVAETIRASYPVCAVVCKQAAVFIHYKQLELDRERKHADKIEKNSLIAEGATELEVERLREAAQEIYNEYLDDTDSVHCFICENKWKRLAALLPSEE